MYRNISISGYILIISICFTMSFPISAKPMAYNIRDYGAIGDSMTLNTQPIQSAIDACALAGGGIVNFPAGKYISGTLFLRNHITLNFEAGAVLIGSGNIDDYPVAVSMVRSYTDNYTDKSLIYGDGLTHVGITGKGIINGNGKSFEGPYKVRPFLIRMINCKNVLVRDITMMDSPMWLQHYLLCKNVIIDGITVNNRHDHVNNDGIDIDACSEVRLSNCRIISGDDAIVLKSTLNQPCKNITITNCIISTNSNAIKVGSETNGNFENIVISNCTFYDTHLGGIALQIMDGGILSGVSVSNIIMNEVGTAILIRLGNRARPFSDLAPKPEVGRISDISFSNIQATNSGSIGCSVSGLPGFPVSNISFKNIRVTFPGGGKQELVDRVIPDTPSKYPDVRMFGMLPAYGFFCRHADNLCFDDVEIECFKPDARPAMVFEDISGLELCKIKAMSTGSKSLIRCSEVKNLIVQSCIAPQGIETFLEISGTKRDPVTFLGNDLRGAKNEVLYELRIPVPPAHSHNGNAKPFPDNTTVTDQTYDYSGINPVANYDQSVADAGNNGMVMDPEGNKYKTVVIGGQTWMAENLKTTKLNDGTLIPLTADSAVWNLLTTPGFAWYKNDSLNSKTYGALYNWFTVNTGKLCPTGWHIPGDAEWATLSTYLGGAAVAGGKLKEPGSLHWINPNKGATNETGFTALPGGYRDYIGRYFYKGTYGGWWSADPYFAGSSRNWYVYSTVKDMVRTISGKTDGYSVRCVKDF